MGSLCYICYKKWKYGYHLDKYENLTYNFGLNCGMAYNMYSICIQYVFNMLQQHQNSYPMKDWHLEHMQKTIVKYVTGLLQSNIVVVWHVFT